MKDKDNKTLKDIPLPKENELILIELGVKKKGSKNKRFIKCKVVKEYKDYFLVYCENNQKDTFRKIDFLTGDVQFKIVVA